MNHPPLDAREWDAAGRFIERVRRFVQADLFQASLFGSKARGTARPDSDVDVLLIFRRLAWDREPHATHAEMLADEVARETDVPITAWSVSLPDLETGSRTPMLVDALEDSVPLWAAARPIPPLPFTPYDALRCVRSLLDRIAEGSDEFRAYLDRGDIAGASLRARDDLVRGCTAVLLTLGITRPRRGEVIDAYRKSTAPGTTTPGMDELLNWARDSFGEGGQDDEHPVPPPPGGPAGAAQGVDLLRLDVRRRARRLEAALPGNR
ncbi:MAG: nucleotidyltransferase domain-containing protein [Gemmatimonadetes bacterium]|nr:nucleotidyltransferase domain-containing protein [Gemmatimonadota bacterium]